MSRLIAVFLQIEGIGCWCVSDDDVAALAASLPEFEIRVAKTEEEFLELLPVAEIAVTWKFANEWLDHFPNIKIIATPAAGDGFVPADSNGRVCIIHGAFHGEIMSETITGLVLAHARQLFAADYMMKHSYSWPRVELDQTMRTLKRSHVAILGFGTIGMMTAEKLKAFGCRITGIKQSLISEPAFFTAEDSVVTLDKLDSVLSDVDHLVAILPATEQTDNIIAKNIFDLLPDSAAVYNFGRGNAVNEDDLIVALNNGNIAAAYLDVFKTEPLPADSTLRSVKNLFLFPHSSAISPEYLELFFAELPDKLKTILSGN